MTDPANKESIEKLHETNLELLMSKGVYNENTQIKVNKIEL